MSLPAGIAHVWYKCKPDCSGCEYCDGGLALCTTCGCAEGELLTWCPGHALNDNARERIYRGGVIDFSYILAVREELQKTPGLEHTFRSRFPYLFKH